MGDLTPCAAGDVARFVNPDLGSYLRVEHEDNANAIGRAAGQAMAGVAQGLPTQWLVTFTTCR